MKKQISITITDVDDINKVLMALESLFKQLMNYYLDKEERLELFERLIYSCFEYFKMIVENYNKLLDQFGE